MTEPEPLQFIGDNEVRWRGRALIYFAGCDYFRLARDPRLAAAAKKALAQHGLNVAASRRTTGNHKIYAQLETELAAFFGAETALLLPDGYLAPLAVAQALAGDFTHAFIDEFAHGALVDAAQMLGCPVKKFQHRDSAALAKLISKCGPERAANYFDGRNVFARRLGCAAARIFENSAGARNDSGGRRARRGHFGRDGQRLAGA